MLEAVPTERAAINVPEQFANYVTGDQSETFLLLYSRLDDEDRYIITLKYVDGRASVTAFRSSLLYTLVERFR